MIVCPFRSNVDVEAENDLMELTEENIKNSSQNALLCKNCSIDYEDKSDAELDQDLKLSSEDRKKSMFRSPVALIAITATASILLLILIMVFLVKLCCK